MYTSVSTPRCFTRDIKAVVVYILHLLEWYTNNNKRLFIWVSLDDHIDRDQCFMCQTPRSDARQSTGHVSTQGRTQLDLPLSL